MITVVTQLFSEFTARKHLGKLEQAGHVTIHFYG